MNVVPVSVLGATFLMMGRESLPLNFRSWRNGRPVTVGGEELTGSSEG